MNPMRAHPGAEPAALGYLCAPSDKRDALAHELYAAEGIDLARVIGLGVALGIDRAEFTACVNAQETQAELARQQAQFRDAGLGGLPATFVESEFIKGFNEGQLRSAVDRAVGGGLALDIRWLVGLVMALVGVPALLGLQNARKRGAVGLGVPARTDR
jgi:hypothetical protein